MKRVRNGIVVVFLLLGMGGILWVLWQRDTPRRRSVQTLETLCSSLKSGDSESTLRTLQTPQAIQGRTLPEQAEFIRKALHDEISSEGIGVLKREGQFGSLTNLFPAEAKTWAAQAGVKPEDCVAFKLERNGLRAEVVLAKLSTFNPQPSTDYRIVRCNNVKQLAAAKL